jgi:hypothetical protein
MRGRYQDFLDEQQERNQTFYRSQREFDTASSRLFADLENGRGPDDFQRDWNNFTSQQKQQTRAFTSSAWETISNAGAEQFSDFSRKFWKPYSSFGDLVGDVLGIALAPIIIGIAAATIAVVAAIATASELVSCVFDMGNLGTHVGGALLGVGMMLTAAAIGVLALVSPILQVSTILSRLAGTFCEGVGIWDKSQPDAGMSHQM